MDIPRRLPALALALALGLGVGPGLLAGCGGSAGSGAGSSGGAAAASGGPGGTAGGGTAGASGGRGPAATGAVPGQGQPLPAGHAPAVTYPVGTQTVTVTRPPGRTLATSVWYPARTGGPAAPAAPGSFPVILFSHGLLTAPGDYAALLRGWASAGFVVVAPAYPHTSRGAPQLDVLDVAQQPADASYLLDAVLRGGLLHAGVDPRRVGAAGHSAGGITTGGLFAGQRDPRLVAGVVLAGSALGVGDAFTGPPAWLLFVHGDADPLVPYRGGRLAYQADPWPKEFLLLSGQGHVEPYLDPGTPSFAVVAATTTDFWRLALDGDRAAGRRLAADARSGSLRTSLTGTLATAAGG
jgi:dienelactone hydrolase